MAQLMVAEVPESGEGDRVIAIAHGIFGRGRNWRTFARALVEACPGWRAALVDLREHGESATSVETPGPHTLEAAAADVRQTLAALPVAALLGHSFGGKVMLAARELIDVPLCWMIDSSPSARPEAIEADDEAPTVVGVLRLLESLPARFASRTAFVEALAARGVTTGVAQFLAMNLARVGDSSEMAMAIDLAAIRELLTDYFAVDLWSALERPERGRVHVAIAGRGSALDANDQARLDALSAARDHVAVSRFPEAGHWVHVDAPAALVAAVAASLHALD